MSRLSDRLAALPPDARAAVLVSFDQEGLDRLMYWRHLYETGRLIDDTTSRFELEGLALPDIGQTQPPIDVGEYYW